MTVKVSPNANNNGHNGNNGSQGNGNSGSHNNGTNGDQGQGDKDKKDQAGKDTNNGLDKLFSNSGNGSASGDQSGASRKQAPALPNTGDASNPAMALAFAALLGGTALAMKKRKKKKRSKSSLNERFERIGTSIPNLSQLFSSLCLDSPPK